MANKLNTKGILDKAKRELDKNARSLQFYCNNMTNNISGAYPGLGKDTGRLNRSLQLVKTGEFQYKLGFYAEYSFWALKKKGDQMRYLIGDGGLFHKHWSNSWKKTTSNNLR